MVNTFKSFLGGDMSHLNPTLSEVEIDWKNNGLPQEIWERNHILEEKNQEAQRSR